MTPALGPVAAVANPKNLVIADETDSAVEDPAAALLTILTRRMQDSTGDDR